MTKKTVLVFILAAVLGFAGTGKTAMTLSKKITAGKIFSVFGKTDNRKIKNGAAEVYFTDEDEEFAYVSLRMAETYYPLICGDMGLKVSKKAEIIIYPEKSILAEALGTEEENVPMGAYFGGVINILSPRLWAKGSDDCEIRESFMEDGPLLHEFVHFVMDENISAETPMWFSEGLALFYERKYTGFEWRPELEEAAKNVGIDALENGLFETNEALGYRKSYDIIRKISEESGEEAIKEILGQLSHGRPFARAAEEHMQGLGLK